MKSLSQLFEQLSKYIIVERTTSQGRIRSSRTFVGGQTVWTALVQPFRRPWLLERQRRDIQRVAEVTHEPGLIDIPIALESRWLRNWSRVATAYCSLIILWLVVYTYARFQATPFSGYANIAVSDQTHGVGSLWRILDPIWLPNRNIAGPQTLLPRLVGINIVVIGLTYYQNVLSDVTCRGMISRRFTYFIYEFGLKAPAFLPPTIVLFCEALDDHWWLTMSIASGLAMTLTNFLTFDLLTRRFPPPRDIESAAGKNTQPQKDGMAEYATWRWSMLIYSGIIGIMAIVVYSVDYGRLYTYAAVGLIFVNVSMHYTLKLTLGAPRLRGTFCRLMLYARRDQYVSKLS
jgi:hypothetical protein